ncbi:MAG: T9SS type A sorting domain-containing protein [Bacteroidota bacterium]
MKKQQLFLFYLLSVGVVFGQSVSPEVVGTAGDHYVTDEVQMSFTIGEIITETTESDDAILTQGFHQPTLMITAVDDLDEQIAARAFPNPTADIVNIELDDPSAISYLEILSSTGQVLLSQRVSPSSNIHSFDLSDWVGGTYLLQLVDEDQQILKTFKIIKSR